MNTNDCAIFALAGHGNMGASIARHLGVPFSEVQMHTFPDQECSVRIQPGDVRPVCIITASLFHPNAITLPLIFLAATLREYGAKQVLLVAPYLAYMRQDKRFHEGDSITARYYARLLSQNFDGLITVDPHLHRIHHLDEVYSIPSRVVSAAPTVSRWIAANIERPVLIGPDSESLQWVEQAARELDIPFMVLEKIRHNDVHTDISAPDATHWLDHKPVLFDDIISTGGTMAETIRQVRRAGMQSPVCIGVHGVFSNTAYADLMAAGAEQIITTDTIVHSSNAIEMAGPIAEAVRSLV